MLPNLKSLEGWIGSLRKKDRNTSCVNNFCGPDGGVGEGCVFHGIAEAVPGVLDLREEGELLG